MKFLRVVLLLLIMLVSSSLRAQDPKDPKWFQASTDHFVLFTDTTEVKAQRLLTDLEARLAGFSDVFGKMRPRQFPITVFVFKTREDFVTAIPNRPPVDGTVPPEKNAYLMAGPDRIFLAAKDKSPEDIANDAGHALGHALFEHEVLWRPFWLAEGVAEYVRKMGRDADTKAISDKDGFSVDDLLTIVPSAGYEDSAPPTAFRTQSYRLLRVLLQEEPQALRDYVAALGREDGSQARLNVKVEEITSKFAKYTETPLKLSPLAPVVKTVLADPARLALAHGDLLMATNRTSEASRYYNGTSDDARAARAIVTRFSRRPAEGLQALARAAEELSGHGLVQYHFGTIETENVKERAAQSAALERAVKLLPLFGRAHAELARVYALTGKGEQSLPLVDRAIALEPEFGDHFFEIRAGVFLALGRADDALRSMKVAEMLPHADRLTVESYTVKTANLTRKIELARREVESQRVERIRRDLEAKVNEREPVVRPPPPVPVREGQIKYEITATAPVEIVEALYPEYPEALRREGKAGRIVLRVEIAPDGKVRNAVVNTSQLAELNAATVEAAKKWTFKLPARARPSPVNVTLTFVFALQ